MRARRTGLVDGRFRTGSPPRFDGRIRGHFHSSWSRAHRPVLEVDDGETVEVDLADSSMAQLGPRSTTEDLRKLDYQLVDAAAGPIFVRHARPGRTLEVEILDLKVGGWGWSAVFREFGFLKGRFDDDLVVWKIASGVATPVGGFLRKVRVPVRPMLGVIGVAPPTGELPMIPPGPFGGNMDCSFNGAGTRIRLPIFHPGALLSLGDPHAAQGDGEVCGTGIETPATARIRVHLIDRAPGPTPSMWVPAASRAEEARWVSTGIAPDLEAACRQAVEQLLAELHGAGWTEKEAYLLASVAGNLRIAEVVDDPERLVSFHFPARLLVPPHMDGSRRAVSPRRAGGTPVPRRARG